MSTKDPADLTKAQWRRRALRAEAQVETLRMIRDTEWQAQRRYVQQNAARDVAIREIAEALSAMTEAINE